MAKRYVVRNDAGAGASFRTKAEAEAFLKEHDGYQLEDAEEPEAKAVESAPENKAVKRSAKKSDGKE